VEPDLQDFPLLLVLLPPQRTDLSTCRIERGVDMGVILEMVAGMAVGAALVDMVVGAALVDMVVILAGMVGPILAAMADMVAEVIAAMVKVAIMAVAKFGVNCESLISPQYK
jgi:hypothetical protein